MLNEYIATQIYSNFVFTPTFGQKKIIEKLSQWIAGTDYNQIFILNGYAGTGKTTLVSAFVKVLKQIKIKPIILAPTGHAAKVAAQMSGERANTIHKKIYRQKNTADFESKFSLDFNREKDACFIVDESSMISDFSVDGTVFGSGSLLDDLFDYVRQGTRCRIMFVGDSAQLPPVGHDLSPALNPSRMSVYGNVVYGTLEDVVRQQTDSGILFNATMVRCMIEAGIYDIPHFDMSYPDFKSIEGSEILELIESSYSKYGREEVIVITRSNKRANKFNEGIRGRVLFAEEEIEAGDMLMIVKNNYHYTEREENCRLDFMANGDTAYIKRLRHFEQLYGFRFAEARLAFPDYDDYEIGCKILIDTLSSEAPSLTSEQNKTLYMAVEQDYADIKNKSKRYKEIRENAYFNAVQVKFAYAVTCHKAQGGQWRVVFIDKMLFGEQTMSKDLLRWLYTAISRAVEQVYLVNFDERFIDAATLNNHISYD